MQGNCIITKKYSMNNYILILIGLIAVAAIVALIWVTVRYRILKAEYQRVLPKKILAALLLHKGSSVEDWRMSHDAFLKAGGEKDDFVRVFSSFIKGKLLGTSKWEIIASLVHQLHVFSTNYDDTQDKAKARIVRAILMSASKHITDVYEQRVLAIEDVPQQEPRDMHYQNLRWGTNLCKKYGFPLPSVEEVIEHKKFAKN